MIQFNAYIVVIQVLIWIIKGKGRFYRIIKEFIMNFHNNGSLLDKIKKIYRPYKKFGLIYSKKDGNIYFNGKLVRKFYDEKNNITNKS